MGNRGTNRIRQYNLYTQHKKIEYEYKGVIQ